MIKDKEVAIVNAATMALEYKEKHPRAWDDDAVAFVMKNIEAPTNIKIYAVAAANEILKVRVAEGFKSMGDKQILQQFVDNIYAFVAKIDAGMKE